MYERVFRWVELGVFAIVVLAVGASIFIMFPTMKSEAAAAWIQAVGSIGAIIAAVYVMHVQGEKAARLAADTDKRALLRRASAVGAIFSHAIQQLHQHSVHLQNEESSHTYLEIVANDGFLNETIRAVAAVPLHELGSHDMVAGFHLLAEALKYARDDVLSYDKYAISIINPAVISNSGRMIEAKISNAEKRFLAGVEELASTSK